VIIVNHKTALQVANVVFTLLDIGYMYPWYLERNIGDRAQFKCTQHSRLATMPNQWVFNRNTFQNKENGLI